MVVLNNEDSRKKIRELLDLQTNRRLLLDPTAALVHNTRELLKLSSLEPDVKKTLNCSEELSLRLYRLTKLTRKVCLCVR